MVQISELMNKINKYSNKNCHINEKVVSSISCGGWGLLLSYCRDDSISDIIGKFYTVLQINTSITTGYPSLSSGNHDMQLWLNHFCLITKMNIQSVMRLVQFSIKLY
jgi:PhoPQ-activated pathogenicity-related protein